MEENNKEVNELVESLCVRQVLYAVNNKRDEVCTLCPGM
mgnify:FL=1